MENNEMSLESVRDKICEEVSRIIVKVDSERTPEDTLKYTLPVRYNGLLYSIDIEAGTGERQEIKVIKGAGFDE